jgi:hypothetical protein
MECSKLLARTSGLGVNEPTSFFAMNTICTFGHVYTHRDGVPVTYSKCVVSLRKDYAQEVATQGNTLQPNETYEFAYDDPTDPLPVLFPARIAMINGIKGGQLQGAENQISDAIPNPANDVSTIRFKLNSDAEQAILQILQVGTGRVLQNVEIKERGTGEIQLDLKQAASGVYSYRLMVNGLPGSVKKLLVTH